MPKSFWSTVKYFKPEEFDSPGEPWSGQRMDPYLIKMLDELRARYGGPIIITSGFRTQTRNDELRDKGYETVPDWRI